MLRSDILARTPLKLRHLQLLVALDETRTLARAAQRLRTTQPAASRQLSSPRSRRSPACRSSTACRAA